MADPAVGLCALEKHHADGRGHGEVDYIWGLHHGSPVANMEGSELLEV